MFLSGPLPSRVSTGIDTQQLLQDILQLYFRFRIASQFAGVTNSRAEVTLCILYAHGPLPHGLILGSIPEDERILLFEDAAEIQMAEPNLVWFEAQQAQNVVPTVTIRDVLKATLRRRFGRLILGEIRGG